MKSRREERTIGEIADVIGGGTPSTTDPSNFGGDIPWLTPKDLAGSHNRYIARGALNLSQKGLRESSARLLPTSSVLVSSRAPIGYVAIAKNPIATNQGFRNLVLKPGFDPEYVYYWLTAHVPDLERLANGSTFMELSGSSLKQIAISTPPLPEQRAIAHILGTLDNKIELNRRTNETLEAMARALFKSWFINFDPVHAKAEGRDSGLPADITTLFPGSFEDSDLGEIPQGWNTMTLHDLASHVARGISPIYADAGGVCVLNQKCIRERRVDFSKARRHDASRRPVEDKMLRELDILVNSTGVGTLGRMAQLWDLPEAAVTDSHITTVRANRGVNAYYLGIMLTGRESEVEALGEGSTGQTELSRTRLSGLHCVVPPSNLRNLFGRMTAPMLELISAQERNSLTLATLRDTLLPKLLSAGLEPLLRAGRLDNA